LTKTDFPCCSDPLDFSIRFNRVSGEMWRTQVVDDLIMTALNKTTSITKTVTTIVKTIG